MTAGQLSVAFAPRYEYTHPKRIYVFRADVPVRMDYIYNRNHIQNEKINSASFPYAQEFISTINSAAVLLSGRK